MFNTRIHRPIRQWLALFLGTTVLTASAFAQDQRPVRVVVGLAPGGLVDVTARLVAEGMRGELNRPILIENKPGAATRIAASEVRRAAPDGNTLLFSPVGTMSVMPHLFSNTGYAVADFIPVGGVASFDYLLAVAPNVQANNLRELIALLKTHPEHASIANPGTGTIPNILATVLAEQISIPLQHIPYKGTGAAAADVMAGHVSLLVGTPAELINLHESGKLRVIAAISDKRSSGFPNVPTLAEQGLDLAARSFMGLWAPVGTPPDTIAQLNQAMIAALRNPDLQRKLLEMGLDPAPTSSGELQKEQEVDSEFWGGFIRKFDIKVEG